MDDPRQGIVHIIGPEQGFTLPGMTIVCGDSHTSTHGAFGALAFGIGTSEVEHVLATQTLIQHPAKNMRSRVDGALPLGVTAKDLILAIIAKIGTAGGHRPRHRVRRRGHPRLSMEGRMTVCNMSIEGGARAGLIAPDETTFDYLEGPPHGAQGRQAWEQAVAYWRSAAVRRRRPATTRRSLCRPARSSPRSPGALQPEDVVPVTGRVPAPERPRRPPAERPWPRALEYMGLTAGTPITEVARSTRSSSAPAPTAGSKTCARPPPGRQGPPGQGRSVHAMIVVRAPAW